MEIMICNSVLIWILGLLWKLDPLNIHSAVLDAAGNAQGPLSYRYTALSPLHRPGETLQLREVAVEICMVFDFQVRNIKDNAVSSLIFLMLDLNTCCKMRLGQQDNEQHYLELCCLLIGIEARAKHSRPDEPISEELVLARLKDN